MPAFDSALTLLRRDDPATLTADWWMDESDRRRIDNQVLALQENALRSMRGQISTWYLLSTGSAAITAGDVLVSSPNEGSSEESELQQVHYVTKATAASLAAAGAVVAIALTAAAPGGWVRVAVAGVVGASITGLATGAAGPVRVNTATGRCERVGTLTAGSYGVGFVDSAGNLTFSPAWVLAFTTPNGGVFDVTAYGAVGNGTTDDTTAITNAKNAAVAAGGGIVYFPKGQYRTTANITVAGASGVIFRGAGRRSSFLRPENSSDVLSFTSGCDGCGVEDLAIERTSGAWPGGGTAVIFSSSKRCFLSRVNIALASTGVWVTACTDIDINGLRLYQMFGARGISAEGTASTPTDRVRISDVIGRNPFASSPTYRGNWATSTTYSAGDVVYANSAFWQCVLPGFSGSGAAPSLVAGSSVSTAFTLTTADAGGGSVRWIYLGGAISWLYVYDYANNVSVNGMRTVGGDFGIVNTGTGNNSSGFRATEIDVVQPYNSGILFDRGNDAELHGARVTQCLGDNGLSVSPNYSGDLRVYGGLLQLCRNYGALVNGGAGAYLFDGVEFLNNSQAGAGAASGIALISPSKGSIIGGRSSGPNQNYGVGIGAGCDGYVVVGVDVTGNQTPGAGINDLSASTATYRVVARNAGSKIDRASLRLTGRTAALGATNFFPANPPAGLYEVNVYGHVTAGASSGTMDTSIAYTDDLSATSYTTSATPERANVGGTGRWLIRSLVIRVNGSSNVALSTIFNSVVGTPTYSIDASCVRLGV